MFIAVLLERYEAGEKEGGLGQPAGGGWMSALENPLAAPVRDDKPLVMKSRRGSADLRSRGINWCVTTCEPETLRSYVLVQASRMVIRPAAISPSNVAPGKFRNECHLKERKLNNMKEGNAGDVPALLMRTSMWPAVSETDLTARSIELSSVMSI